MLDEQLEGHRVLEGRTMIENKKKARITLYENKLTDDEKEKLHLRRIRFPMFGKRDVVVFFGTPLNLVRNWLARFFRDKPNVYGIVDTFSERNMKETAGYHWFLRESELSIVWTEERDLSVLAHELSHVTWSLLDSVGIKDNETFAYTMEYLMEGVFDPKNDMRPPKRVYKATKSKVGIKHDLDYAHVKKLYKTKTQSEIAKLLGITQQWVSEIVRERV